MGLSLLLHSCRMGNSVQLNSCSCSAAEVTHCMASNNPGNYLIKNNSDECCKNKLVDYKFRDSFLFSNSYSQELASLKYIALSFVADENINSRLIESETYISSQILLISSNKLYVQNSVFLI
jgi:hypothetical protein